MFEVKNLKITIDNKEIIQQTNFTVKTGEITVIMGPNGSGKSTLAHGLMGHPKYDVSGSARLDSVDLLTLPANERSKAGLFLSFQYPVEIEGVRVKQFLRQAVNAHRDKSIRISEFKKELQTNMELLKIPREFVDRYMNKGFSGGEKKKMEILQLLMLKPKVAILDETDSGLDIDALRTVCEGISTVRKQNPDMAIILITHYQRILNYLEANNVLILSNGKIVKEGGHQLAEDIEQKGYEQFIA